MVLNSLKLVTTKLFFKITPKQINKHNEKFKSNIQIPSNIHPYHAISSGASHFPTSPNRSAVNPALPGFLIPAFLCIS